MSEGKKRRVELDINSKQPFTNSGQCSDEVTFEFDDGQKLYVSQNFLHYVSPVFTAMFQQGWKEKETRIVKLKGKDYQDFLEFLLCLHPDVQKPVSHVNVLQIVPLAEEYQAGLITKKCKQAMLEWLDFELQIARKAGSTVEKLQRAKACLKILITAENLNYKEIVEDACKILVKFGHTIFTGAIHEDEAYIESYNYSKKKYEGAKPANEDPIADCKDLFDKLPQQLKYNLILERLRLKDDTNMK